MEEARKQADENLKEAMEECRRTHDTSVCVHYDLKKALAEHHETRQSASDSGLLVATTAVDAFIEDEEAEEPSIRDTQALRILGADSERSDGAINAIGA